MQLLDGRKHTFALPLFILGGGGRLPSPPLLWCTEINSVDLI